MMWKIAEKGLIFPQFVNKLFFLLYLVLHEFSTRYTDTTITITLIIYK